MGVEGVDIRKIHGVGPGSEQGRGPPKADVFTKNRDNMESVAGKEALGTEFRSRVVATRIKGFRAMSRGELFIATERKKTRRVKGYCKV